MKNPTLKFQAIGNPSENLDVRFDDFIRLQELMKKALSEVDRTVNKERKVYFRVIDLTHSSPASITLEPVPTRKANFLFASQFPDIFFNGLSYIQSERKPPDGYDSEALEAIKDLSNLVKKGDISKLEVYRNGESVSIGPVLGKIIDEIIGPDEFEEGSVVGYLHQLNIHQKQNVFTIYPTSRQPKVICRFPSSLKEQVIQAVDKYVEVFGRLKYKKGNDYPYEMSAREIDVYPPEGSLPTIMDLKGMAPCATGDVSSEDFVRSLRDEW